MDFVIALLKEHKKGIERNIKRQGIMRKDMTKASHELAKVSKLKRAIKILKLKNRK